MERLGDEAARLLAAAAGHGGGDLSAVTAAWPGCVGDAIANAAWPLRLSRDGTLHVATVSSTWAFELERLGGQVVERLGAALGGAAPTRVRFAPGPVPERPAPVSAAPAADPTVSAESRAEGERIAAGIADPDLRRAVARAAAASLESRRSDRRFC
jgi:hypothetical protein